MNVEQSGKFLAEPVEEDESARMLSPKKMQRIKRRTGISAQRLAQPKKEKLDLTPELCHFQVIDLNARSKPFEFLPVFLLPAFFFSVFHNDCIFFFDSTRALVRLLCEA